jgi:tRNA(Ile)-lysidine synthetase-like protein
LREHGATPCFDLVERLRSEPNRRVTAAGRRHLWSDGNGRVQESQPAKRSFLSDRTWLEGLSGKGRTAFGGLEIRWWIRRGTLDKRVRMASVPGRERFDADRMGGRVMLRHWQPGDRFRPLGLGRSAKLQDLFTNAKIPAHERPGRVIAENEKGEIVWVEGLRIGESCRIGPGTDRVLEWRWRRTAGRASGVVASKNPVC